LSSSKNRDIAEKINKLKYEQPEKTINYISETHKLITTVPSSYTAIHVKFSNRKITHKNTLSVFTRKQKIDQDQLRAQLNAKKTF
jgi:hypothetical protein